MHQSITRHGNLKVVYRSNPDVTDRELTELYAAAWEEPPALDFRRVLDHSLSFICAYYEGRLIGFVRLVWDGGLHAFLLDPTVHPEFQRCGIGRELVRRAVSSARDSGVRWVHVDYEPRLRSFYERCSFQRTEAGLLRIN